MKLGKESKCERRKVNSVRRDNRRRKVHEIDCRWKDTVRKYSSKETKKRMNDYEGEEIQVSLCNTHK